MISAITLQNELTRKLHLIDSEYGKSLSVEEKDRLLNEAKDMVYENFIIKPELNSLVRSHLRPLEVKKKRLTCAEVDDVCCVAALPGDYFRLLRATAQATTSTCSTSRDLIIHMVQSHKLNETLKSPNWSPSFEYEETIGDEGERGLYVWHNGKFNIDSITIDYMKVLPDIYTPSLKKSGGSYEKPNGEVVTENQNFMLDSTAIWRKVVDMAVLLAQKDLSDPAFQAQAQVIMSKERTYV